MTTEDILEKLAKQDADIAEIVQTLTNAVTKLTIRVIELENNESRKDNHRLTSA